MVSYVADAILLMRQARELGLSPKAFLGGGAGLHRPVRKREVDQPAPAHSTQWTET